MTYFVLAPMVNVNDNEMTLVEWLKPARAEVRPGELIAVLETTKSTADLEAAAAGYLRPLVEAGAAIEVGQVLAAITATADEDVPSPPTPEPPAGPELTDQASSAGRAWTRKAEIVARKAGLDIAAAAIVPADGARITEADVNRHLADGSLEPSELHDLLEDRFPDNVQERVLVVGAGGAALQILDVVNRVPHQRAAGLVDDNSELHGKSMMGSPILGGVADLAALHQAGRFDAVIISIGLTTMLRAELFARIQGMGLRFTNVIDPDAQLCGNVRLGVGNAVMPLAHLGAAAAIGDNNFISTYVNIEHHTRVGSHCTFGPGVMTSGAVRIGDRVKFGTGVFIEPELSIGDRSVIASGSILTRSIPAGSIVKTKSNFTVRPFNAQDNSG